MNFSRSVRLLSLFSAIAIFLVFTAPALFPDDTTQATPSNNSDNERNATEDKNKKEEEKLISIPEADVEKIFPENKNWVPALPDPDKKTPTPVDKTPPPDKPTKEEMDKVDELYFIRHWTPFQAGLFHPVQIFSRKYAVKGWRFSFLYTLNQEMDGFDLSALGLSSSRFVNGFQTGIAGEAKEFNGVQLVTFSSAIKKFNGVQFSVFELPDKNADSFCGFRMNCISDLSEINEINGFNIAGIMGFCKNMNGVQMSYAAINEKANGVQMGIAYNEAKETNGVQFGIVNYCKNMSGVQIGLLNFAPNNWLIFSIGINFGF